MGPRPPLSRSKEYVLILSIPYSIELCPSMPSYFVSCYPFGSKFVKSSPGKASCYYMKIKKLTAAVNSNIVTRPKRSVFSPCFSIQGKKKEERSDVFARVLKKRGEIDASFWPSDELYFSHCKPKKLLSPQRFHLAVRICSARFTFLFRSILFVLHLCL